MVFRFKVIFLFLLVIFPSLVLGATFEKVGVSSNEKTVFKNSAGETVFEFSLYGCVGENNNCNRRVSDAFITQIGNNDFKSDYYDSVVGSGTSYYQFEVSSKEVLIDYGNNVFGFEVPDVVVCSEFGCLNYTRVFKFDMSGSSAFHISRDDDYNSSNNDYNFTPNYSYNLNPTGKILKFNFFSNGSIDPSVFEDVTAEASSGNFIYENTDSSDVDNAIHLNRSVAGWAFLNSSVNYNRTVNVTNISIVSYHDFAPSSDSIVTFRLEDGSGNPVSEEGVTYTNNGADWVVDSVVGTYSLDFVPENNDWLQGNNDVVNYTGYTVGYWGKRDSFPGDLSLAISQRSIDAAVSGWLVGIRGATPTKLGWLLTTDCSTWNVVDSDFTIVLDQWYHLVVTWDGTTGIGKMFVNGTEQSTNFTDSGVVCVQANDNISIGASDGSNSFEWDGHIDSFFILNRSMSDEEIVAIWNATRLNYVDNLANVTAEVYNSSDNISFTPCSLGDCVGNFTKVNFSFSSSYSSFSEYLYNYTITYENVSGEAGPVDSCTYTSGDWDVTTTDYCVISSNVDTCPNTLNWTGTNGNFTVDDDVVINTAGIEALPRNFSFVLNNRALVNISCE